MSCYKCSDSGFIAATDRINQTIYGFRCSGCGAANRKGLSQKIPFFQDDHLTKFKPDYEGRVNATFTQGGFVARSMPKESA